jgi:hypothetical protein
MKLTKALATDERLPRPLRWAIGIALALKAVPLGALLLTVFRPTFREIVAETRSAKAEVAASRVPAD